MKTGAIALGALLVFGVATVWIDERWAWSLFQIGVFGLAACCVASGERRPLRVEHLALAAAAAWPLLQLASGSTVCHARTWSAALDWLTFALVFALAHHYGSHPQTRDLLLRSAALFGMGLAALAILQNFSSPGTIFWLFPSGFDGGVFGPFVNRNQFAAWLELLLPPALYLAFRERRFRLLYGTAAATVFGAVVASASRAGFVVAGAEVLSTAVAIALIRRGSRKGLAIVSVQFAGLAILAAATVGWHGLHSRMRLPAHEALRADAWRASVRMVRDRPWAGSGLGTWSTMYPRYASFDTGVFVNQAHNDWAQWAAEGGVPFLALLIFFAARLSKPAVLSIYGLGTLAFLLHATVDYPMQQRPAVAAWFFAVAGLTLAGGTTRPATDHGLLRGIGRRLPRFVHRNPPRLPPSRSAASPGSMPERSRSPARRVAAPAFERDGRGVERSGGAPEI